MKTNSIFRACLVIISLFFIACSTTKNIPDDDQLFVGLTKIDYQSYEPGRHFDATQEEIEAALATAPNGALFGSSYYRSPFTYGLWIWNYAYGSHGKFKQWLNRSFGDAPVLMSKVNPALRASVAKSVLRKNGYLHGTVDFHEVPQKNPKKMKIGYTVRLDTLFTVDSMEYVNFPADMRKLIDSTRAEAKIGKGSIFDVASLDGERSRVSRLLRNNGYYYFQPSYATYLADTFQRPCHALLRLQMADSLPPEALRKWFIGKTTVSLRSPLMGRPTDSLQRRSLTVLYSGKHPAIRPRVILRNLKLRPRRPFSYDDYLESAQKINATGVFSSTDFVFTPRPGTDTLDMQLNCTFDKLYDFYVETSFINRTIGRYGPELKVGITRRNAFRGAEKLDINLHGSYQWQKGGQGSTMNSYQYGADAAIEFPRIITPFNIKERTPRLVNGRLRVPRRFYATPWTVAKVSTDIIRRPSYYKMHIVSGEWNYRWQPSENSRHEYSPLTLKYQFFNSRSDKFLQMMEENPYLYISMGDYFIPKMRYTYTYASPSNYQNPIRWETTVEEAGNLASLYFLAKGEGWNEKDKKMFKNPYSQFFKVETFLTKTWRLDTHAQLVGHLNMGYMYYYGNSSTAPFSENFYVGGANSIRAFTVRSIGPGAFHIQSGNSSESREFSYLLQNGNIKFQANLEYRQMLFDNLYGAIFLDAGNVWSDDNIMPNFNEGSASADTQETEYADTKLHASTFLKQLATGTGIGLRYDLDFLVIRIDWGFGLHLPYDTGKSGYFNIPRFRDMHSLHFAIGYPF